MPLMASELMPVLKAFGKQDAEIRIMAVNGVELRPEALHVYSSEGDLIVQIVERKFNNE